MITTLDRAGRLVIPNAIRTEAGFEAGVPLEVHVRRGRVEISVAPRPVTLRKQGAFLVAEATDGGPELTADEVRRAIEDTRSGPAES